jgi:glutaminyl-tRNA synthetase
MEEILRQELDSIARRAMCVLRPIKVTVVGGLSDAAGAAMQVPDFPQVSEGSATHALTLTPTFYMDATDFRDEDAADYFGLAPQKWVGLKYSGCIFAQVVPPPPPIFQLELRSFRTGNSL